MHYLFIITEHPSSMSKNLRQYPSWCCSGLRSLLRRSRSGPTAMRNRRADHYSPAIRCQHPGRYLIAPHCQQFIGRNITNHQWITNISLRPCCALWPMRLWMRRWIQHSDLIFHSYYRKGLVVLRRLLLAGLRFLILCIFL